MCACDLGKQFIKCEVNILYFVHCFILCNVDEGGDSSCQENIIIVIIIIITICNIDNI